ncbi:MAG TPA: GNAT family N-acetyltransferase [Solirubrobacteraceae bacterium]
MSAAGDPQLPGRDRPAHGALIRQARAQDIPALLEMFAELAEYEHLTDELRATEPQLQSALFGPEPAAQALIAELESSGAIVGYALFFGTFSSFLASSGVWLEDLFVCPSQRRFGVGRALLLAVAALALKRGAGRLEWSALEWNEPALRFYEALGAHKMPEWIPHRLTGGDLERLANQGLGAHTC